MGGLISPPAILIPATVRGPLAESMWTSEPGKEPPEPDSKLNSQVSHHQTQRFYNPFFPKQWHDSFLKYTVWQRNRTCEIRTISHIQGLVIHKHQRTTRNFSSSLQTTVACPSVRWPCRVTTFLTITRQHSHPVRCEGDSIFILINPATLWSTCSNRYDHPFGLASACQLLEHLVLLWTGVLCFLFSK